MKEFYKILESRVVRVALFISFFFLFFLLLGQRFISFVNGG